MTERRTVSIATHSGSFHADDVLAYVILDLVLSRHGCDHVLTRTRKRAELETAGIVFDIGLDWRPATPGEWQGVYDHHQAGRPHRPDGEPYAAAGLLWQDFGRDALRELLGKRLPENEDGQAEIEVMWSEFEASLIRPIERVDNGLVVPGPTDLAVMVDAYNPPWDGQAPTSSESDAAFQAAALMVRGFMERRVDGLHGRLSAERLVLAAYARSLDQRLLELTGPMPWVEAVHRHDLPVLYATYRDGPMWYVRCCPTEPDGFANRLSLPESWGGLNGAELQKASGVPDADFCHPNRFIAGATSEAGARAMASVALAQAD